MDKNKTSLKKDYTWNTVGSAVYALSSMVLAFFAMHFAGPDDGGVFSFGFSTVGQQMFIIAYFGIRPYHITDTKHEYSYEDYRKLRLITSGIAALAALIYLAVMTFTGHYGFRKCSVIFLLVLYKICDAIADLYESECQRIDKLYIGGMELTFRTLLSAAVLCAAIVITRDLIVSSALAVGMQMICISLFRSYLVHELMQPGDCFRHGTDADAAESGPNDKETRVPALVKSTLLIFLSVFVDFFIFSAAKYAVDFYMTDADNGIFNILFMPTSVIYLAANFIIKPYMTRLARVWDEKSYDSFQKAGRILFMYILIMSVIGVALTYIIGKPVLHILETLLGAQYTGLLTSRHYEFIMIILGGCFYAVTNLYYYLLIIMRKQEMIFMNYLIMAIGTAILSIRAVTSYGMTGAAAAYAAYMLLLAIVFASTVKKNINIARGEEEAD